MVGDAAKGIVRRIASVAASGVAGSAAGARIAVGTAFRAHIGAVDIITIVADGARGGVSTLSAIFQRSIRRAF